jgi:hypothetical protein
MTRREFVGWTMATTAVIAGAPAFLRGQNLNAFMGYQFVFGTGSHSGQHGGAILPDTLR